MIGEGEEEQLWIDSALRAALLSRWSSKLTLANASFATGHARSRHPTDRWRCRGSRIRYLLDT